MTERMDRFDEGVEVIVRLLAQETTDFEGEHYRLSQARCEPKPIQRPHLPIAIGGGGEKRTLKTVRGPSGWDGLMADPEEWKHKHEVLTDHCEAIDRDPTRDHVQRPCGYARGDDPEALADAAAERFRVGVDVVVFSMRSPYDVSMIEPLANALAAGIGRGFPLGRTGFTAEGER